MDSYPSSRAVGAALFLLAKQYFPEWDGWPENEAEVISLAGLTQGEVDEVRSRLLDRLYDFLAESNLVPCSEQGEAVLAAVIDFAKRYPAAIVARKVRGRRIFGDAFLSFLVGLLGPGQPGEGLTLAQLSSLVDVPLVALNKWVKSQA